MYKNTVKQIIKYWIWQYQIHDKTFFTDTDLMYMKEAKEHVRKYFPLRHTNMTILTHENLNPQRRSM